MTTATPFAMHERTNTCQEPVSNGQKGRENTVEIKHKAPGPTGMIDARLLSDTSDRRRPTGMTQTTMNTLREKENEA